MGPHVLAISINNQIQQVGAIAGLAAILGLAVLSLLYFAQAREVKRLREWAGRAPERDAELKQSVVADAQRRVAPQTAAGTGQPAAAAATAAGAAGATTVQPAPGAPPAAGAKAGTPGPPAQPAKTATPGRPAAPGSPAQPAKSATPGTQAPGTSAPGTAAPGAPAPGTPAPGTSGAAKSGAPGQPATAGQPAAPGSSAGAAKPAAPAPATAAAPRPRRTVQVGGSPPASAASARGADADSGGVSGRAIAVAAVLAIAVVVVLLVSGVIGGSGDKGSTAGNRVAAPKTTPDGTPIATTPVTAGTPAPADTVVTVLNGTTIPGLARTAADTLQKGGYKIGRTTDAADQAQQTSQVAYATGFRLVARRVARAMGISSAQVAPIDASTRVVAGSDADVVVTMGLDKAPAQ